MSLLYLPAGAVEDADAALMVLPGNSDALYVRAYALDLMASARGRGSDRPMDGSSSSGRASAEADDVTAAFQAFLDAAPVEHLKRPHAHYFLAFHALLALKEAGKSPAAAALRQQTEALYQAGLAAEQQLPPFFLPVECSVKGYIAPMLRTAALQASDAAAKLAQADYSSAAGGSQGGSTGASQPGTGSAGSSSSSGRTPCCDWCGAGSVKLMRCSRCQQRCFCSKECQVADWKAGHASLCGK